jgi:hypothetical protein
MKLERHTSNGTIATFVGFRKTAIIRHSSVVAQIERFFGAKNHRFALWRKRDEN